MPVTVTLSAAGIGMARQKAQRKRQAQLTLTGSPNTAFSFEGNSPVFFACQGWFGLPFQLIAVPAVGQCLPLPFCFASWLDAFRSCIFVFYCFPTLDEEPVRVVVTPAHIAQIPLGNQASHGGRCCTDQFFCRVTFECEGVSVHIESDAVHTDLLADVPGNQVCVVTVFPQVVVLPFGAFIGQVQRFADIRLDHFIVRVEAEKILVECPDVVAGLYRDICFSVGCYCFQCLSVRQDVDMLPAVVGRLVTFINGKAGNEGAGCN